VRGLGAHSPTGKGSLGKSLGPSFGRRSGQPPTSDSLLPARSASVPPPATSTSPTTLLQREDVFRHERSLGVASSIPHIDVPGLSRSPTTRGPLASSISTVTKMYGGHRMTVLSDSGDGGMHRFKPLPDEGWQRNLSNKWEKRRGILAKTLDVSLAKDMPTFLRSRPRRLPQQAATVSYEGPSATDPQSPTSPLKSPIDAHDYTPLDERIVTVGAALNNELPPDRNEPMSVTQAKQAYSRRYATLDTVQSKRFPGPRLRGALYNDLATLPMKTLPDPPPHTNLDAGASSPAAARRAGSRLTLDGKDSGPMPNSRERERPVNTPLGSWSVATEPVPAAP